MKIIFLLPHLRISGGGRIALTYADLLANRGHEVAVVVRSGNKFRRLIANFLNLGKPKWIKNFKPKVIRVAEISLETLPRFDYLVACDYITAAAMNSFAIAANKKIHIIMHDERLYHGDRNDVEKVYSFDNKKIVISTWLKNILKNDFGKNTELLITPVDYNLFHEEDVKKENDIRILMLHHTYDWKGVSEGTEAIGVIRRKNNKVKFILFGARKEHLDIECDEYYYNIPQNKLASLYSSCDIFLCPSWYEGLGMPAMEAMACGTAVVTFDTGGSRDYAFDGETAFVAKHRDINDLIKKLELAVNDSVLRSKIAKNGQEFITKKIDSWEKSVEKFEYFLSKE